MTPIVIAIVVQAFVSLLLIIWARSRVRLFLDSGEEIEKIRREISALVVELDASAERNVSVIEDRLASLKDVLADADKKIALLSQDRTRRLPENMTYNRLGQSSENNNRETASKSPVAESNPEPAELPFIRFSEKPLPIEEPFADKVVALSRRGFSSDIIAARLGATMAEVDLVLSLERERASRTKEP